MASRVGPLRYEAPRMCDGTLIASGWRVMIETRRVQHRFEVAVDRALSTRGISYAQFRALELLLEEPDLHVSELARRLRLSRQNVASTIEKLERVDLIEVAARARARLRVAQLPRQRTGGTSPPEHRGVPSGHRTGAHTDRLWSAGRRSCGAPTAPSLPRSPTHGGSTPEHHTLIGRPTAAATAAI